MFFHSLDTPWLSDLTNEVLYLGGRPQSSFELLRLSQHDLEAVKWFVNLIFRRKLVSHLLPHNSGNADPNVSFRTPGCQKVPSTFILVSEQKSLTQLLDLLVTIKIIVILLCEIFIQTTLSIAG